MITSAQKRSLAKSNMSLWLKKNPETLIKETGIIKAIYGKPIATVVLMVKTTKYSDSQEKTKASSCHLVSIAPARAIRRDEKTRGHNPERKKPEHTYFQILCLNTFHSDG